MDSAKVVLRGDVSITNTQADTRATLPDGVHSGPTMLPLWTLLGTDGSS